jgi:non-heme chloroperoxidase
MEEIKSPETKEISVNGIALSYIEQGKGNPIVLVHGGLSDYRMWEGQMEPFSQEHRVIAYSRRYAYPNKATDDSVGFTVVPHAKDLAAFIKALNTAPVHLVGHSYGAYTALLTAIDHPELVKSLCLGEPPVMSLLPNTDEGNALLFEFETKTVLPSAQAFEKGEEIEATKIFLAGIMGQDDFYDKMPPEVQQQIQDNIPELKGIVCPKIIFLFSPFITCADVKKVKAPTLLMNGEISPRVLIVISDELEKCLPQKERVMIPHASHEMEIDNPQAFNEAILRFIQKYD